MMIIYRLSLNYQILVQLHYLQLKLIAIDENQIAIVNFGFLIKYTEQRRHSDGRIVDEWIS